MLGVDRRAGFVESREQLSEQERITARRFVAGPDEEVHDGGAERRARGLTGSLKRERREPQARRLLSSQLAKSSFVASFKTELIAERVWRSRSQLELAIVEYVGCFNSSRLHEALGDIPPGEFELSTRPATFLPPSLS